MFIHLHPHHFYPDINECTQNPEICGLGTCANNDDGTFYECICQDGAMTTGTNTNGSLTCVGRLSVFTYAFVVNPYLTRYR